MSEWAHVQLKKVLPVSIPGEWGSEPDGANEALVLRAADFTKDCKLRPNIGVRRSIPQGKLQNRILKQGDFLIEKSGGSPDQPVGRAVLFDREDANEVYSFSNFLQLLRGADGWDRKFIYYLLLQSYSSGLVYRYQQQTTGIYNLKLEQYLSESINAPKFDTERKKIAEILETVDEAIEQTEALIAKYEQIKAGMMQDLFTRGLTPDGKLRLPRHEAPDLYKETPIGRIPKEWEIKQVIDLAQKQKGATVIGPFGSDLVMSDYRNSGVPVVFVRDIGEGSYNWVSNVFVGKEKALRLYAHRVTSGDLLITKMGLPPCVACVYPNGEVDGVITADIIRMTPDTSMVDRNWLCYALNFERTRRQVAAITAGVTRPKVTLADFRSLRLAVAKPEEQISASAAINYVQSTIDVFKAEASKLNLQKLGLMHDLLTGKVPVKV